MCRHALRRPRDQLVTSSIWLDLYLGSIRGASTWITCMVMGASQLGAMNLSSKSKRTRNIIFFIQVYVGFLTNITISIKKQDMFSKARFWQQSLFQLKLCRSHIKAKTDINHCRMTCYKQSEPTLTKHRGWSTGGAREAMAPPQLEYGAPNVGSRAPQICSKSCQHASTPKVPSSLAWPPQLRFRGSAPETFLRNQRHSTSEKHVDTKRS